LSWRERFENNLEKSTAGNLVPSLNKFLHRCSRMFLMNLDEAETSTTRNQMYLQRCQERAHYRIQLEIATNMMFVEKLITSSAGVQVTGKNVKHLPSSRDVLKRMSTWKSQWCESALLLLPCCLKAQEMILPPCVQTQIAAEPPRDIIPG
jgi:hypothetical protein